jgi:hypothetical protein
MHRIDNEYAQHGLDNLPAQKILGAGCQQVSCQPVVAFPQPSSWEKDISSIVIVLLKTRGAVERTTFGVNDQ